MAESRWDNFWSGVATHANEAYGDVRQAGRSVVAHGEQAADYVATQGTRLAGGVERNAVAGVEYVGNKEIEAGKFLIAEAPKAGEFLKDAAVGAYNFAIGDDIKTLRDPNASGLDKVLAGVSIASNFVGPEGKVAGRGLELMVKVGEKVLEHGGMAVAEREVEKLLGKEGMKALEKGVEGLGKFIEKSAPQIEKVLTKAAELAGAVKGAENIEAHVKKTMTDMMAVFRPGASIVDRVKAAAEVAIDVKDIVGDVKSIHKGVMTGKGLIVGEESTSVGRIQTQIKNAHGDDAERTRVGNHAFVETDHAIFDARGGKTMRPQSIQALGERAAHDERPVIVIGKDLDHDTVAKLGREGVFVAKDAKAAKLLETELRVPGVDRLKMLEQQFHASPIGQAYDQRKNMNSVRDAPDNAVQSAQNMRIGVGQVHDAAVPYDHKLRVGTVTHVAEDRVEQFVGNGKYMTYTNADLHGHIPKQGDFLEVSGNGKVVIQPPGHGQAHTFDPQSAGGASR